LFHIFLHWYEYKEMVKLRKKSAWSVILILPYPEQ